MRHIIKVGLVKDPPTPPIPELQALADRSRENPLGRWFAANLDFKTW